MNHESTILFRSAVVAAGGSITIPDDSVAISKTLGSLQRFNNSRNRCVTFSFKGYGAKPLKAAEPAAQSDETPVQQTQPAIALADLLPILNKHLQGRVVRDIFNDIPQQQAGA